MAEFDTALLELGKLLGFIDPKGEVLWTWFKDPKAAALDSLPSQRESIGALIRALKGENPQPPTGEFNSESNWELLLKTDNLDFGIAWSKQADLHLGFGAKASINAEILTALARLINISSNKATSEIGQATFTGTFPVPSFLSSGELDVEIKGSTVTAGITVSDLQLPKVSRTLEFPEVPGIDPTVVPWDSARLAVFVLKAWIQQRAAAVPTDTFFKRVNDHLFPMMGEPSGMIQPFPLMAAMKSQPDFKVWGSSILTTNDNASGALTFLWHLRALLTGNESSGFLTGSYFFPLSGAIFSNATAPTLADSAGDYSSASDSPGAWVGILTPTPENAAFSLVLDLTVNAQTKCQIPLATFDGTIFTRPPLNNSWVNIVGQIAEMQDGFAIGNGGTLKAISVVQSVYQLSLLRTTVKDSGFEGFDGDYDIAIQLEEFKPPEFILGTPALTITFPPANNPEQLFGDVAAWTLKAAAPKGDLGELIAAAVEFIQKSVPPKIPDTLVLLGKVVGLAGTKSLQLSTNPDVVLDLNITKTVNIGIEFGPIESGEIPIFVGLLKGLIKLNPAGGPILDSFTLGFDNLRLGNKKDNNGVVASLIPDMKQFPGFNMTVDYSSAGLLVTGGGKVPIQRTLGPLDIAGLLIDIRKQSFSVALDLSLQLAAIKISAYELGVRYDFNSGAVEPFLHGLALSMNAGPVKMAGFFGAVETNGVTDYVGNATVAIAGYFELSAIGGYTKLDDNTASLFIFAALIAPLGGPPWFFITGVAGGFGFNRSLPAPGLLLDHPFIKVMRGEIAIGKNAGAALRELSLHFAAMKGQNWIAAGIQFNAFGLINGKVIVAVGLGKHFSINVLGMASFGISPICYFEIVIDAVANEEKFSLQAQLTPNSYVIHPDIFSLQGGFALCAWYKLPHKGDFLFSIGGYHPLFAKPDHYPEVLRVGCKAVIYNFVHLSVEVFFACTPQALMAGAKLSIWAEFAGIAAGLDIYVDVLMRWDPFSLMARMGVHIWFEFFGRHEIGVDLDIWTPDFGGIATIDMAIVKFDVEFGGKEPKPKDIPIFGFVSKQLSVPAQSLTNNGFSASAFSTDTGAGLFRIEFLKGRSDKNPPAMDDKQEGISKSNPVHLNPEWSFMVRTKLPIKVTGDQPASPVLTGEIDLPLCGENNLSSILTIEAKKIDKATPLWLVDYFPAANFGDPIQDKKKNSQDTITSLSKEATIPLTEGVIFDYAKLLKVGPNPLIGSLFESSMLEENYPLPLGKDTEAGGDSIIELTAFASADLPKLTIKYPSGKNRRVAALADINIRQKLPFTVKIRSANVQRFTKLSAGQAYTVAKKGTIPLIAPPSSPTRPVEMFGVQLRVLPMRSNQVVPQPQMVSLTKAVALTESLISPRGGVIDAFSSIVTIPAGRATQIEFGGGGIGASKLRLNGNQTVRALLLNQGGRLLSDAFVRGSSDLSIPKGAAQAVLIGEGNAATITNAGIERDSILLVVGNRQFVGHGCYVSVLSSFAFATQPMDSLPGADLFQYATNLCVYFQPPIRSKHYTFILKVVPTVKQPTSAVKQVRWLAAGAQFSSMTPVITADKVALVMAVTMTGAWSVEIDLGPEWKLDGIVLVTGSAAHKVVKELQSGLDWDLIDDTMPVHTQRQSSTVNMELLK